MVYQLPAFTCVDCRCLILSSLLCSLASSYYFLLLIFPFPFSMSESDSVMPLYIPALSTPATYIEPHIGRLTQGGSYSGQFIHGAGGRKAIAWCVTLTCSGVRQLETPTCEYVCGKASFTVCFWTRKRCV